MTDYAAATIVWGGESLTLLELMKQLMGVTDNTQDTELSMYLQMAGEAAEKYIDNKIVLQEVVENFIRTVSPIALRYYPVGGLTSVVNDGTDETDSWSVYAEDGIYWITKGDFSGTPFKQLTVTYNAGFDPIPAETGYAIATIAINYEQSGGSASGQVKKEVINGVGSVEYVTSADADGNVGLISPATIGVLDKYRRFHV